MASLPARQPSQQRPSPTAAAQHRPQSSNTTPITSGSGDSQTIFVNESEAEEQTQEQQQDQAAPQPPDLDDPSVKKCWICFSDSTEDTPETSPWRDPCPCALVAHEECLLDWIADMEAPGRSNRSRGLAAPRIQCPQCKSEIKLARPRDYLVDTARLFERLQNRVATPGAVMALSGVLYNWSMAVGVHSIYAIFGADDGFRILRPVILNATRPPVEVYAGSPRGASVQLLKLFLDHIIHWRLYIGLPLIHPLLVLSRTSLADGILPVLPIVFFASQAHSPDDALDLAQWPPSASFAFAMLPYARSLYNFYYKKVWAEREKQWLKEIQPRAASTQNEENDQDDANQDPRDDDNVFELQLHAGDIWEDWEDDDAFLEGRRAPEAPQAEEEDAAAPAPNVQDNRPVPGGGANEQPVQQAQHPQAAAQPQANQPNNLERGLRFSATSIAETILGALVFPTIAGLTGEALKLVLPTSWTTHPTPSPRFNIKIGPKGLLQQKWARSLIGGCLFVVCKDALMLYVRWKMVQMHRGRRVVDFDRRKGKAKKSAAM